MTLFNVEKNDNQKLYIELIKNKPVYFCCIFLLS